MPRYDYQCASNGRVLEVSHGMHETVSTWERLCELAAIDPGDTPLEAPVSKLVNRDVSVGVSSSAAAAPRVGGGGGCCNPGGCGCH